MENEKPLRILHVVGAMNLGGTETMLMNIYRNMDRERVQFDFLTNGAKEGYYDAEIKSLGGRIIRIERGRSIKQLYQAIRDNGPYEAVHAHTLFHCGLAMLASALAGVKTRISHAHTTSDFADGFMRKLYIASMKSAIAWFSTDLLACSNEAGRFLFGGHRRFTYFPNVIPFENFLAGRLEDTGRLKAEEQLEHCVVIGHIGRFTESKNHPFLIEIMKCLRLREGNYKLLLVGDGDLRRRIQELVDEEGLADAVRFAGIREDVPLLLNSMDVFVFPSTYEGLGLALLEAQACGLPCIVSEAIQPEADLGIGLVTKVPLAMGAEAWADAIIKKAGKKERDIEKIANGFERKRYSVRSAIASLADIYGRWRQA